MAIVKTHAIPIKIQDYSETSVIANFLTRDFGLVRAVFKGARRKGKAYENTIDLLLPGQLVYYERSAGLNIIKEFSPEKAFSSFSTELERYKAAMACLEFVRATSVEGQQDSKDFFNLFISALSACSSGRYPWSGVYSFILFGLAETGFLPSINQCSICGGDDFPPTNKARTAFSYSQGGTLCMSCGKGSKIEAWLTGPVISAIRQFCIVPPEKAVSLELDSQIEHKVRGFLKRWCEFAFERAFRMLN